MYLCMEAVLDLSNSSQEHPNKTPIAAIVVKHWYPLEKAVHATSVSHLLGKIIQISVGAIKV